MTIGIKAIFIVVKGDDGIERVLRLKINELPIVVPIADGEVTDIVDAIEWVVDCDYPDKTAAVIAACFDEVKMGRLDSFGLARLTGEEQ